MVKCKIIFLTFTIFLCCSVLSGCNGSNTLLLLNWGEYINDEVVEEFEEKYNCVVNISIADSNELFYSKIKSGTTVYDLVVPSDYMVQKMVENDLLESLDFSKLPHYDRNNLLPGVQRIMRLMNENSPKNIDYSSYFVPYFWGTWGIMYNKNKEGLEESLNAYGWDAYFDRSKLPKGTKVGMYNSIMHSYAAVMCRNHLPFNEEKDEYISLCYDQLKAMQFDEWGTDTMKKSIAAGNLDLAFVWTGDCLDMLYSTLEDGTSYEDISFDIYIPHDTIAFMDNLVMTKAARHKELAYQFIDFMLETEHAKENASVVGYCTPYKSSYQSIVEYEGEEVWDNDWAYAVSKYYPYYEDESLYQGTPLSFFSKDYMTEITNMINNVKTGSN